MYHIFFVHSSFDRYLSCFQFLTIMNKAAMNMVEQVSLWWDEASFGYMLGVEVDDLHLLEDAMLSSIVAV